MNNGFIQTLTHMVTQSVLTRMLANVFLFSALMVCLGVGAFELITTHTVDSTIYGVLLGGVMACLSILGINQGVTLQPLQPKTPPKTQTGPIDTTTTTL